MWNFICVNKACEKLNQFRIHKDHIERLYSIKSRIETNTRKKPKFLFEKQKKKEIEKEESMKINYENKILFTRVNLLFNKPSPYNKLIIQPKTCPAFDKSKSGYMEWKRQMDILKDNANLKTRLIQTKPSYSTCSLLSDYRKSQKMKFNLSIDRSNSFMNHATLSQFKQNLNNLIMIEDHKYFIQSENTNCENSSCLALFQPRTTSAYTHSTKPLFRNRKSNKRRLSISTQANTFYHNSKDNNQKKYLLI